MGLATSRSYSPMTTKNLVGPFLAAIRSPKSRGRIPRIDIIIEGRFLREPEWVVDAESNSQ